MYAYQLVWYSCFVAVSGAGSGVSELTNQRRLGILEGGLKETAAKTFHTEGEYSSAALDSRRVFFLFFKLKHIIYDILL